jgi:predicted transcriptional regulator
MRSFEVRAAFEKVFKKLDIIDAKVSAMPQVQVQVSEKFLPTLNALTKLGKPATSSDIAQITGRNRATESQILNELAGRGVVIKARKSRRILFSSRRSQA